MQTLIHLSYLASAYFNRHYSNSPIDFHWVGNLTETSATIKVVPSRFYQAPLSIDLAHEDTIHHILWSDGVYTLHLTDLEPATQ